MKIRIKENRGQKGGKEAVAEGVLGEIEKDEGRRMEVKNMKRRKHAWEYLEDSKLVKKMSPFSPKAYPSEPVVPTIPGLFCGGFWAVPVPYSSRTRFRSAIWSKEGMMLVLHSMYIYTYTTKHGNS